MKKGQLRKYLETALIGLAIWAGAAVLYDWYRAVFNKQPGSFEYVRKAEEFLGRGEFRKSIDLFEKAYSSSPENNIICAKLRNAYLNYGQSLADAGKTDSAISCMMRAHTVMPGSGPAQKLALIYAGRASEKLRSGDIASARAGFEDALKAAAPYASSSRNLGIFLYNKAAEDYKAGKNTTAVVFLKESSLAYKNTFTLELLGDIYYNRSDFENARFYYGKSFSLDRANLSAKNKLKRSVIDFNLAKGRNVAETPHFKIMYSQGLPLSADFVRGVLEKCYFDIGSDFRYFPGAKTQIVFYSQEDFRRMFMMSAGTRAIYDGNIRVPLPHAKLNDDELAQYLRHEYTHAVISAKTNNNCPVWLSEGLAVWEVYRNDGAKTSKAAAESLDDTDFTTERLKNSFDLKNGSEEGLRRDYLLSYSAVRYVIDTWGLAGMNRILDRIKNGEHFLNAVDDEFLVSESEFNRRWKAYSARTVN